MNTLIVRRRIPVKRHWDAIAYIFQKPQMTPDEFLKYWSVTYAELAKLCERSEITVKCWFLGTENKRKPTQKDMQRLAEIHQKWSELHQKWSELR